jgi:hypothetical protein
MINKDKFSTIKNNVQEIIFLIRDRNRLEAIKKLAEVSIQLQELLDHTEVDTEVIEISRYQLLLDQLNKRIIELDGQFN